MTRKQRNRKLRLRLAKRLLTEDERALLWGIHKAVCKGYKPIDKTDPLEKGSEVYIRAEVDEAADGFVICRNSKGYYFTVPESDLTLKTFGHWEDGRCSECGEKRGKAARFCGACGAEMKGEANDELRQGSTADGFSADDVLGDVRASAEGDMPEELHDEAGEADACELA